ncbi:PTS sugar transporter subunit IIA [Vibrio sp. 10N.261.51.F12]|uniref:PTS sugar transporter subunit IIA n=1 Tax=Vibrio sp. 10N.261.51.F12 TaxID=3229679 RepID=UPI00354D15DA
MSDKAEVTMYFDKKLSFFNVEITDRTELLKFMSDKLLEAGFVKDSFQEALLQREVEYPTGLEAAHCGVALPHTDSIHVNDSQVCFVKLKTPIKFRDMVDASEEVEVKFVFMLAMKEAHEQIENLQNLTLMLESASTVEKLHTLQNRAEFEEILRVSNLK